MISKAVRVLGCLIVASLWHDLTADEAVPRNSMPSVAFTEFRQRDADHNDKLSTAEFLANTPEADRRRAERDYRIVDFDADGQLSFSEFARMPGIDSRPEERGSVPDPIADAFRAGWKEWQQRFTKADRDQDRRLSKAEWSTITWRGLVPGTDGLKFSDWDSDNDGVVTEAEQRQLLELVFGFRLPTGEAVRWPDESIETNWIHVRQLDRDQDSRLSREEFVAGFYLGAEGNAAAFRELDLDHDGIATPAELSASPRFMIDTLVAFLWWDRNLDGFVDRDELLQTKAEWQESLALRVVRAFDDNRDGKLSFREFRGSPFADQNSDWYAIRTDGNHDGLLSWSEYLIETSPRLIALSRLFFDRFDLDHSGTLSWNELEFQYDASKVPADVIFKAFDRSLDGQLTVAELMAFVPVTRADPTAIARADRLQEYAEQWLKRTDANQDGRLSRAEFRDSAVSFQPKQFNRYRLLDTNGDGRLSREEYIHPVLGTDWEAAAKSEAVLFDQDDDGFLSWKEFLASPRGVPGPGDRFYGLDQNEDNYIGLHEFLRTFPEDQRRDQRLAFFRMDSDDDGRVSREEWLQRGNAAASMKSEFRIRDENSDGFLSLDEFLNSEVSSLHATRRRDFRVVDKDQDGQLSIHEFRCLPYVARGDERGVIVDPIADSLEQVYEKLLAGFQGPNSDQGGSLKLKELPRDQIQSIAPELARIPAQAWDLNHDSLLTAQECHRVLEIAFGFQRASGDTLRTPAGIVVNLCFFRQLDVDRDGTLVRQEFVTKYYKSSEQNAAEFNKLDVNSNDILEWSELLASPDFAWDALPQFFWLDRDLDGQIDQLELDANASPWQESMAKRLIRVFDDDGDGRLSLREFRRTPFANPVADWYFVRTDQDQDGKLSWNEFYSNTPEPIVEKMPALTGIYAEYFHRFDLNRDGVLDHSEFDFTTPTPPTSRIFRAPSDESQIELVVGVGTLGVSSFGSPALSHDGKRLAFDATPPRGLANDFSRSQIAILQLEGSDVGKVVDVAYGNCPDWSPDDSHVAFFLNGGNPNGERPGVWIARADGKQRRPIAPGLTMPRWSPDGNSLLCTTSFSGQRQVMLVDVDTKIQEVVLKGMEVDGAPAWDPNGKRVAVNLTINGHQSLCLVDLHGGTDSIVELARLNSEVGDGSFFPDNTRPNWSPDGEEIIYADRLNGKMSLFRVSASGDKPAKPIQLANQASADHGVWSLDRKVFYFGSSLALEKIPLLKNPDHALAEIQKPAKATKAAQ